MRRFSRLQRAPLNGIKKNGINWLMDPGSQVPNYSVIPNVHWSIFTYYYQLFIRISLSKRLPLYTTVETRRTDNCWDQQKLFSSMRDSNCQVSGSRLRNLVEKVSVLVSTSIFALLLLFRRSRHIFQKVVISILIGIDYWVLHA
jgi:hypothetical protein